MNNLMNFSQFGKSESLFEGKPGYANYHGWGGVEELSQTLKAKMDFAEHGAKFITDLLGSTRSKKIKSSLPLNPIKPIFVFNVSSIKQIEDAVDLSGGKLRDIFDASSSSDISRLLGMTSAPKGFYVLKGTPSSASMEILNKFKELPNTVLVVADRTPMSPSQLKQAKSDYNLTASVMPGADPDGFYLD